MDTIEAILSRRSIRKYSQVSIPRDIIEKWVTCGMHAPSAGNEQPWHFLIINESETLKEIPKFHNHGQMLKEASTAILICIDQSLVKHDEMAIQDCAAATQNILLAIHSQGYGAVWLGVYPRKIRIDGLRKLLQIPENIIPFSLISIGKPAEKKSEEHRFDKNRLHYEKW
jgi:nitroreductase